MLTTSASATSRYTFWPANRSSANPSKYHRPPRVPTRSFCDRVQDERVLILTKGESSMIQVPQAVLRDCYAVFRPAAPRSNVRPIRDSRPPARRPRWHSHPHDATRRRGRVPPSVTVGSVYALTIPLAALADCQSCGDGTVQFQALEGGRVEMQSEQAGVAQRREYTASANRGIDSSRLGRLTTLPTLAVCLGHSTKPCISPAAPLAESHWCTFNCAASKVMSSRATADNC